MRTKNSTYNMIATMASYLVALLFNFITQAIFIKTLGIEYLGVNGLFTNILTMLAVAELGIGSTIVYKLYKPLAEKDYEKIKSWMNFYKKCYNWITINRSNTNSILRKNSRNHHDERKYNYIICNSINRYSSFLLYVLQKITIICQ